MFRFIYLVVSLCAIDLGSKFLLNRYLSESIDIRSFLQISISYNEDLAFSIPMPYLMQIILSLILLVGLGYILWSDRPLSKLLFIGGALIYGGAMGNLFERIFYGAVTDFISFSFWPSFNFADCFIVLGAFILFISGIEKKDKKV